MTPTNVADLINGAVWLLSLGIVGSVVAFVVRVLNP